MNVGLVLGYKDLFSDQQDNYEDLMMLLSSESAIRVCSALNNELNGSGGMRGNQKNILHQIAFRFSKEQKQDWDLRYQAFLKDSQKVIEPVLFNNRNFLDMVLKELNRKHTPTEDLETQPITEYNFLKAYMLVVDEAALKDNDLFDLANLNKNEPLFLLKLLWVSTVTKFEYLEKSSQIFETFKTMCFFKFLLTSEYRKFFSEYLDGLHLKSAGAYIAGFAQLNKTIENFDPNAHLLNRLNYISPLPDVDQTLLQHLSVNLKTKKDFKLTDVKKAPLCYADDRKAYMVIDYNFLIKKMFRGAYFEICHTTSLTKGESKKDKNEIFNTYSSKVSSALEHSLFKPIMQLFCKDIDGVIHFDDATPNVPDCYLRLGNVIFLFEYKAYTFPEEHIINPDFDKFINYLEEKFVKSDTGSPKGVTQLCTQIKLIAEEKFEFDKECSKVRQHEPLYIFPVLVHSDFNYTMPGVNRFLNVQFQELLAEQTGGNMFIAPLVMLNLETICDLAVTGKEINDLGNAIEQFMGFVNSSEQSFFKTAAQEDLLRASSSFDAFYHQHLSAPSPKDGSLKTKLRELIGLSRIDFAELNVPLKNL